MRITRLGGARARFELVLEWRDGPVVVYQHSEGAPGYYHSEWIEGEQRAILVNDQKVSVLFPSRRARAVRVPRRPELSRRCSTTFSRLCEPGARPDSVPRTTC